MTSKSSKILMIGLPETGKTTFLAALWHVVNSPNSLLKLEKLPEQSAYITSISLKWSECKPLERTIIEPIRVVDMKLVNSKSNEVMELIFPDLSGETFRTHFNNRQWTKEYDKLVSESDGIFLFINPDKVIEQPLIEEANQCSGETTIPDEEVQESSEQNVRWNIENVPTQVKIIDLLQSHINRLHLSKTPKIVVIISAWDLVLQNSDSPKRWLEKRLPLLDQYFTANKETIHSTVLGISAQGGNIDIEDDKKQLLDKLEPAERIIVKDIDNNDSNICAPIMWLFEKSE